MKLLLISTGMMALMAQPRPDPRLTSVFPLTMQRGEATSAVIRGTGLDGAQRLYFREPGVEGTIAKVEDSTADPPASAPKTPKPQLVHVNFVVSPGAKSGPHRFRLVTKDGLSNEIVLRIDDRPVLTEPDTTVTIPAVITGRLGGSGEADSYWIEVQAGQSLQIQAISGSDTLDPSVGIYEPSGSWFDAKRMNRVAFNDEPLNFPGLTKDALLTHTFPKAGRYCVRVEGFNGQGGPDSVYELRIASDGKAVNPNFRPAIRTDWEEHDLTRSLTGDWMTKISARGDATPVDQPEIYKAVPDGSTEIPVMKLPGVVEGVIAKPGETQTIRIQVDKAQETVIEVETPEATTPIFTPVVRLLEPGGQEMVGNLYTRLNNNNFQMMKAVMAKTTFSLIAPGLYTLQIHELTTDHAAPNFRYRVLVRQQIPHVGKFVVQQERITLERGNTRPVSVRIDREEGFNGMVAVHVENLPPGVTVMTGIENPNERPTLPNAGKPERYRPRVQPASVVLMASTDAPVTTAPAMVRVVARPIREGRLGDPIASTDIPLLVVEKR